MGVVSLAAAAVAGIGLAGTGVAAADIGEAVVYVSPTAAGGDNSSCVQASELSIQAAVDAVAEDGTVVVCAGTYVESVDITKTLTLRGLPGAVIDASGAPYGVGIGADYVDKLFR